MSRVKGKNTKPEIYVRKLLYHRGFRYRINYKGLPGKPDIYFPKYKAAIFVNGCFWHMHDNCKLSTIPKTNTEFWENKLKGNKARDQRNIRELQSMGIRVYVIWGCEIKEMRKDPDIEKAKIKEIEEWLTEEFVNENKT